MEEFVPKEHRSPEDPHTCPEVRAEGRSTKIIATESRCADLGYPSQLRPVLYMFRASFGPLVSSHGFISQK